MFCQLRAFVRSAIAVVALFTIAHADVDGGKKVATVNGQSILARDVELELLISRKKTPTAEDRSTALERVIDRTLINRFLQKQNTKPLDEDVENLVERTRTGVQSGGETLDAVLSRLKLSENDLRAVAKAAVAWESYVLRTITQKELETLYESRKSQFDGTKVHVRQIVLKMPEDAESSNIEAAIKLLEAVRAQITAGQLDFVAAAQKHSDSPSAKDGGDIGFVRYHGDLPSSVAEAVFALKDGEISSPVRSGVGLHLIQVVERKPGELSLEDARPELLRILGEQLWKKTVTELRSKAKITLHPQK